MKYKQVLYDFANILFAGPCSARCSFCVGRQIDPVLNINVLNVFPPPGLGQFIMLIDKYEVREIVFSGTTSDPQLYRYEARLLDELRNCLHPATRFSLHTNGRQALRKIAVLNLYDRVTISFPSFRPDTYQRMMGVPGPPDLNAIMAAAHIPIKLSCLVNNENTLEIGDFLAGCFELGVPRVVLRKPYGALWNWETMVGLSRLGLVACGNYRGNPVYRYHDMQVTLWDFEQTEMRSINLFSNGMISNQYLLMDAGSHAHSQ